MKSYALRRVVVGVATVMLGATALSGLVLAQNVATPNRGGGGGGTTSQATDPGVRGGAPGAGGPIGGLTAAQQAYFTAAQARFAVIETVSSGLGPGFNELACGNCHVNPASGGSSPATNPQVKDANVMGGKNVIPSFVTANGPIREARFVRLPNGQPDGSVHNLFSIQGRSDAPGCVFPQPNFAAQLGNNNVIFRIPTPLFGGGLIEGVSDLTLRNSFSAQASRNGSLGISGSFNTIGNTQNITRFGWKAQNPSLMVFAGEAYNVEEGVTNEVFPEERNTSADQTGTPANAACTPNPEPEDTSSSVDPFSPPSASLPSDLASDIVNFSMFPRLLAPPTPAVPFTASSTSTPAASSSSTTQVAAATSGSAIAAAASSTTSTSSTSSSTPSAASVQAGFQAFNNVGCSGCHIVSQTVGSVTLIDTTANPVVSGTTINPFSDFAVHTMGTGLADGVTQGNATGNQFRTAPLWGVGQRVFFLHDGRTNNLLTAIQQHSSSGSEANEVISNFNMLSTTQQQNILNFLRDL
jgi:CxxC motif-containing protein (DUF1111 family)